MTLGGAVNKPLLFIYEGEHYEKENIMKKRILSTLLIFTMATTIMPIHAETKLPAGYIQMAKSNPKISEDSEYYTHVKYYSNPITIIVGIN